MAARSRFTPHPSPVKEVHIIWSTGGLSCDGDTVSTTAAEQPSIEDVLLGNIPGLPKVHLHNPVLAPEVGDDFMNYFYQAEAGELDPFVLVVEGSIPNEDIKEEGYWAAQGTDLKRVSRFQLSSGSIDSHPKRGRWWRSALARLMAESMRCKAIPPAAWASPII